MFWKLTLRAIAALVIFIIGAVVYARVRWEKDTAALRNRLEKSRVPISPGIFNENSLEGLPSQVQRYLRLVLKPGLPIEASVVSQKFAS
jgi:hypothetical protein